MKLSKLRKGQNAKVVQVRNECTSCERLAALGLLPGIDLKVIHIAPLGDPITVQMIGQEISIRLAEAHHLEVELIET